MDFTAKHRSWTHKFRRIVLLLALTKLSKEQILWHQDIQSAAFEYTYNLYM